MEVSCSSAFIIYVVGQKKGADAEGLLRASVNSSADLFSVYKPDRVGNFALDGGNATMSPMCSADVLVIYTVQKR